MKKTFQFWSPLLSRQVSVVGGLTHRAESVDSAFRLFLVGGSPGFTALQIGYLKHALQIERQTHWPHPLFALWEHEGHGDRINPFLERAGLPARSLRGEKGEK